MTRWPAILAAAALVTAAAAATEPGPAGPAARPPAMSRVDVIRLAEAFRLADQLGEQVWKGWRRTPFAVLLVTPEVEYLVGHPKPPEAFVPLGYEPALESDVLVAGRGYPVNLLATFPINGVPTVVAGRAEATDEKTSSGWVAVLLHEHFHQLQYADPDYFKAVEALGLSGGDTSGMWMLNFPFPYDAVAVKARFDPMVRDLSEALGAVGTSDFANRLSLYLRSREIFLAGLSAGERKYFAFQTWQEGVAKYTQHRIVDLAAARYSPTPGFAALPDYAPFADVAGKLKENLRYELPNLRLPGYRRVAFYYVGAAEALILDAALPDWHERYFREKLSLEGSLEATGYTRGSAAAPAPRR